MEGRGLGSRTALDGEKDVKTGENLARKSQCAVERRFLPAGAKPARQLSLQPVAVGAVHGGNDMD